MYTLHHVDTCLPDYFFGSHLPVIQILIDQFTTYRHLLDALKDTSSCLEHLDYMCPDINLLNYHKALQVLFKRVELDKVIDSSLDTVEEDNAQDFVYMFFILDMGEEGE